MYLPGRKNSLPSRLCVGHINITDESLIHKRKRYTFYQYFVLTGFLEEHPHSKSLNFER